MKRYIILLVFFKFIMSFGNERVLNLEDDIFENIYQNNIQEKTLKKIKISQGRKIYGVEPLLINDDYFERYIKLVYDRLFIKDSNGNIKPSLVKNFKWLDKKSLYIELRDAIYFHNGDKLKSEDIKFSFEQFKNNNLKYLFSEIEEIKILDDKKLIIKLSEENNIFLEKLTYSVASIYKKKDQIVYGTGMYRIKSLENNSIILEKNEDYFENISDLIEKLEFYRVIEDKKRVISLFNEKVDAVLDIDIDTLESLEKFGIIDKNNIIEEKLLQISVISFGNKYKYSKNEKKTLRKILKKEKVPFIFKNMVNIEENKKDSTKIFSKNVNLKKRMDLIILNSDKNFRIAENIKSYLKRANIELNIIPYSFEAYMEKMKNKDYDLALYDISLAEEDAAFNITKIFLSDLNDYEMYNSLQPFLELLKHEKTIKKRNIILKKISNLIEKELPYIPIKNYRNYTIISDKIKKYYEEWEKR